MYTAKIIDEKELKISVSVVGLLSNNVFLIENDNEAALIDPSCNAEQLIDFSREASPSKIILTHYHFDHVGAVRELKDHYNATVFASKTDCPIIQGDLPTPVNHRKVEPVKVDKTLEENDTVHIGKSVWKVIETPGHTMGSICLYCDNTWERPILLAGDTLFEQSCGRTDFPDSSPEKMQESLAKLAALPDDTLVLPGHGNLTSIENEKNFCLCI